MDESVEKIFTLLSANLRVQCPILSGNMKAHIKGGKLTNGLKITISAPFYDMRKYKETGAIVYTKNKINGKTDYAYWVNKVGAFGTHNKSEGWVNRCIKQSVYAIANEIGGTVVDELGL